MRGQVSVEFFLMLTLVLSLAILLYTDTASQLSKTRGLDKAGQTAALVQQVASSARAVWFEGNASARAFDAFVPSSANCLYWNASANNVYCLLVEPAAAVSAPCYGIPLVDASGCGSPLAAGWYSFSVSSNGSGVLVNCTRR